MAALAMQVVIGSNAQCHSKRNLRETSPSRPCSKLSCSCHVYMQHRVQLHLGDSTVSLGSYDASSYNQHVQTFFTNDTLVVTCLV